MKMSVTCTNCGKAFRIFRSRYLRSERHFCTKNCLNTRGFNTTHGYFTNFLDEETEFSAYFMGLWLADGNISNEGIVSLASIDKQIIDSLCVGTGYKNKIVIRKEGEGHKRQYILKFFGPISKKIMSFGFKGAKTGKEFIPTWISERTFSHFLRGYFDGDGSFIVRKNTQLNCRIYCANRIFLEEIHDKLLHLGIVYKGAICKHGPISALHFGHYDSVKFGEYIYRGSTIKLERKHRKFLKCENTNIKIVPQMGRFCTEDGCNNPARTRLLCVKHANAYYKYRIKDARMDSAI